MSGQMCRQKPPSSVQFAHLGSAYQRARGIKTPRIGILNIGSEASKGTNEIRLAYKKLSLLPSFAGNIEGKSVFDGDVDVLVTDGFTGKYLLKNRRRDCEPCPRPPPFRKRILLEDLRRHLHYAQHPGALLAESKELLSSATATPHLKALQTGSEAPSNSPRRFRKKILETEFKKHILTLEKEQLITILVSSYRVRQDHEL